MDDPWLGAELAGYRIDGVVGRGGSGVVYRATHLRLQRAAALKLLAPGLAANVEYRRRFEREARMTAALEHPHIVPIYDAGYVQDVLYLAMRFVDGSDLAGVIDADAPMDRQRVCRLLAGVADALDTAHRAGLVHRDIKPANVLIAGPSGPSGAERAYLCDFGIARQSTSSSSLTSTGQFLGTLLYCAPEQIRGQVPDGRTDQYALACVVYHCLTGRVPFEGGDPAAVMFAHVSAERPRPSEHVPSLPGAVDGVLARAMATEPAERFADCTTFLHALATGDDPAAAGPAAPAPDPAHTVIWSPPGARPETDDAETDDAEDGAPTADARPRPTPGATWRNAIHAVVSILFFVVGISCFQASGTCPGVTDGEKLGCTVTFVGLGVCCVLTLSVPVLYWFTARRGVPLRYLKLCRLPYLIPVLWLVVAMLVPS